MKFSLLYHVPNMGPILSGWLKLESQSGVGDCSLSYFCHISSIPGLGPFPSCSRALCLLATALRACPSSPPASSPAHQPAWKGQGDLVQTGNATVREQMCILPLQGSCLVKITMWVIIKSSILNTWQGRIGQGKGRLQFGKSIDAVKVVVEAAKTNPLDQRLQAIQDWYVLLEDKSQH